MWRAIGALVLLAGGALPPLGPAPGPDRRVVTERADIVWIPAGWFVRGSDEADIRFAVELCREEGLPACPAELFVEEAPQDRVYVSAYGIDRTEVTHAAWTRCVAANACPPARINSSSAEVARRVGGPRHPVAGVTWAEAQAFCEWRGGRLPTEAEWERAARGHDDRRFPWGMRYNPRLANHGQPARAFDVRALYVGRPDGSDGHRWAAPVGSYPASASPYGLLDMAGNVWEWVLDAYDPEAYVDGPRVDPRGPARAGLRVVRGGSWNRPAFTLRVANRAALAEGESQPDVGLRCAFD